jgi:DNA-binding response OmpR family regulator
MTKWTSNAALRDRIDYLEAENHMLKCEIRMDQSNRLIQRCSVAFQATKKESKFLIVLVQKGTVTREALFNAVYGLENDVPELKIIDVWISKCRKRCKPFDIHIGLNWGIGYFIDRADRERFWSVLDDGTGTMTVPR